MTIEEIFKLATANDVISELKSCRFIPQPDVESANKALDPKLHDIMSPILRPDKRVKVSADNEADSAQKVISTNGESTNFKTVRVARVAVAIQKLIIKTCSIIRVRQFPGIQFNAGERTGRSRCARP